MFFSKKKTEEPEPYAKWTAKEYATEIRELNRLVQAGTLHPCRQEYIRSAMEEAIVELLTDYPDLLENVLLDIELLERNNDDAD